MPCRINFSDTSSALWAVWWSPGYFPQPSPVLQHRQIDRWLGWEWAKRSGPLNRKNVRRLIQVLAKVLWWRMIWRCEMVSRSNWDTDQIKSSLKTHLTKRSRSAWNVICSLYSWFTLSRIFSSSWSLVWRLSEVSSVMNISAADQPLVQLSDSNQLCWWADMPVWVPSDRLGYR